MWNFLLYQNLTGLTMDRHCLQTLLAEGLCLFFSLLLPLPYPVTQLLQNNAAVCVFALSLSPRLTGLPFRNDEVTMSTHTGASSAPCEPLARWC